MEIFADDIIKTNDNSFCVLSFPEGSKLKIDQNSKVKIEKLSFLVDGIESDDTTLYLMSGKLLLNIFKKSNGDDFQIKTSVAAIGVRGTEFLTSLEDDELWIGAEEGLLEVTTPTGEKGFLEAGKGLVVEKKSGFTEPKSYDWVKNAKYGSDSNFSSFKEFRRNKKKRLGEFLSKRVKWARRKEHSKSFEKEWRAKRIKALERRKDFKNSSAFKNKIRTIKKRRKNRFQSSNKSRLKTHRVQNTKIKNRVKKKIKQRRIPNIKKRAKRSRLKRRR